MSDETSSPGRDILALRPATARKWKVGEDGLVGILVPRFTGRFMDRYLMPRLKKPFFTLKLDEIGSFIWQRCDGSHTGAEIAMQLDEGFEEMDDARGRLAQFLAMLFAQAHVVECQPPDSE